MSEKTAAIRLNVLEWELEISSRYRGTTTAIITAEVAGKLDGIPEPGPILSNDEELNRIANLVAGEDGVWSVASFSGAKRRLIVGPQFFVELVMFKP